MTWKHNPFYRPFMAHPPFNALNPSDIVDDVMDRIRDNLKIWQHDPDNDAAYELLADWSAVKRFDPALINKYDTLLKEFFGLVDREIADLTDYTENGLDVSCWMAEAEKAYELFITAEHSEPPHLARMFRVLLTDLDEVQCILHTLNAYKMTVPGFATSLLDPCLKWFADHSDAFINAGTFAVNTLKSFRADLDEYDPDLALTADKFTCVSGEVEAALKAFEYDANPLPASMVAVLKTRKTLDSDTWLEKLLAGLDKAFQELVFKRPLLPQPIHASGSTDDMRLKDGLRYDWIDALDEIWSAYLRLPVYDDQRTVNLHILNSPNATHVVLFGIEKKLKRYGNVCTAEYTMNEITLNWDDLSIPSIIVKYADGSLGIGRLNTTWEDCDDAKN